ncbi:hypothetical protein OnM2_068056 [Erysiphe neolycopersici]|uniref:RRM domain-containing protein n=1 Tax=Erysiphe neolycopersici TaxID=212602 RepID=A0A420HLF1_9PEZI|nr:hypothetical protein OnM2_068056 [Erysiphe neolycopersici]
MLLTSPDRQNCNCDSDNKLIQKTDAYDECLLDQNAGCTSIQEVTRNIALDSSSHTRESAQSTTNLLDTQEFQRLDNSVFALIQKDITTPIVIPYVRNLRRFPDNENSSSSRIGSLNPIAPSFEAKYPLYGVPFQAHSSSMWWNACMWNFPPLGYLVQPNYLELNYSLASHIGTLSSDSNNQLQNTYSEQNLSKQIGEYHYNSSINLNGFHYQSLPAHYRTLESTIRSLLNFANDDSLNLKCQYYPCGSEVSDIFLRAISGTPKAISIKSAHQDCNRNSSLRHGDGNSSSHKICLSSISNTFTDEMKQTSPCLISTETRLFEAGRTLDHKSTGEQSSDEECSHIIIEKSLITTPDNLMYVKKCNIKSPLKISSRYGRLIPNLNQLAENPAHKKTLRNREKLLARFKNHLSAPKMKLGSLRSRDFDIETPNWLKETDPFTNYKSNSHSFSLDKFKDSLNSRHSLGDIGVTCTSHFQSPALFALVALDNRKPNINEILNSSPFVEYCRLATGDEFSILYSVNRAEILAFLGRNAHITPEDKHEPIHIIMDRITSKTLDCYVEFINFNEALNAVNRFEQNRSEGRCLRLGQRYVEVGISIPKIIPRDPNNKFNSGFQGFVTKEELAILMKHIEFPQRSPFAKKCPQRPFEFIISTLFKLKHHIKTGLDNIHLTPLLYKRVYRAGLRCQGFSPAQRNKIALIANLAPEQTQEFGLPPYASCWKRLWAIGIRTGTPNDLTMESNPLSSKKKLILFFS